MKYRLLDENRDSTFGRNIFLVDSPEAVAQAVSTRLKLLQGEWFLDIEAGIPYDTKVIGFAGIPFYDTIIKEAILETAGVTGIQNYVSYILDQRDLHIIATIDTFYGITQIGNTL